MYRIGFLIVTILALALGLIVGVLNHNVVEVDLLWIQLSWPLGLLLLLALALGIFAGVILVWLFSVIPLRLKLRKSLRAGENVSGYQSPPDD